MTHADTAPGRAAAAVPAAPGAVEAVEAGGAEAETWAGLVGRYAAAARSENTWRAYRADVARFERWCAAQRPPVTAVPGEPVVLARYLAAHAGTHRPATLARWCSAIAVAHDLAGHISPTRDEQVRTVLAGIRRTHRRRPHRVAAAAPDDLRAMLYPLDPASPRDARDRALLLIGFAAALRRSELAALRLADLVVDSEGDRKSVV